MLNCTYRQRDDSIGITDENTIHKNYNSQPLFLFLVIRQPPIGRLICRAVAEVVMTAKPRVSVPAISAESIRVVDTRSAIYQVLHPQIVVAADMNEIVCVRHDIHVTRHDIHVTRHGAVPTTAAVRDDQCGRQLRGCPLPLPLLSRFLFGRAFSAASSSVSSWAGRRCLFLFLQLRRWLVLLPFLFGRADDVLVSRKIAVFESKRCLVQIQLFLVADLDSELLQLDYLWILFNATRPVRIVVGSNHPLLADAPRRLDPVHRLAVDQTS